MVQAELAPGFGAVNAERRLSQREAAELLQIDQPKVSAITRGKLANLSLERLLTLVI